MNPDPEAAMNVVAMNRIDEILRIDVADILASVNDDLLVRRNCFTVISGRSGRLQSAARVERVCRNEGRFNA